MSTSAALRRGPFRKAPAAEPGPASGPPVTARVPVSLRSSPRRLAGRALRWAGAIVLIILIAPYALTPLYRFGHPVSTLMLWRWVTLAPVDRVWVPLIRMAPALPPVVIAAEDSRFCEHHGIDWVALRAVVQNAEDGRELRGGSTIAQQVAKNLFLWPGRSFVRKALEFPLALWIDFVLPKRRILEIYLNVAEWGPNGEFGADAGARHAFARPARDLTFRQAALLAAVLPNPLVRRAGHPGPLVSRLAAIYQARAQQSAEFANCLPRPGV